MDGVPIFSLFPSALPATELRGFSGVLNSTTNVVLTEVEKGLSFEDAIRRAQGLGIAETDPSHDLDGWGAAIRERQQDLIDYLIARADQAGLSVRSPRDRNARGGMVNIGVGTEAEKVCHALLDRDVCTDYRGDGIRVSPHFYSTMDEIDRIVGEIASIVAKRDYADAAPRSVVT